MNKKTKVLGSILLIVAGILLLYLSIRTDVGLIESLGGVLVGMGIVFLLITIFRKENNSNSE